MIRENYYSSNKIDFNLSICVFLCKEKIILLCFFDSFLLLRVCHPKLS